MTMHTSMKWDELDIDCFADLVKAVALQGAIRLLIDPAEERTNIIRTFLERKGLTRSEADSVCCYFYSLEIDVAELGAVLGYGLALSRPEMGSFDQWLQDAIGKAGVTMYDFKESTGKAWPDLVEDMGESVQP